MEQVRKEYICCIFSRKELSKVVFRYKNNCKPMLIRIDDKKLRDALINDLKSIYEEINAKEVLTFVIIKNKSEYFCKVRYKDCGVSKVISSECRYCKEKLNCIYMIEKQRIREQMYKYEIVDTRQFVIKLLGNIKFHENYSKVVLYKSSSDSLYIRLSKLEIDKLISSLRPKKLNTNEKEKLNRLCNKCEKLTFIFFSNLENRDKTIRNK
ncbi:MAG: hypothetical protein ACK5NF_03265 [Bacilli bacterium]